jgi:hypothetical protein
MEIDAGERRRSGLNDGSAAREREEGERRCGLAVSLGRPFIGWRRKGRGRPTWSRRASVVGCH